MLHTSERSILSVGSRLLGEQEASLDWAMDDRQEEGSCLHRSSRESEAGISSGMFWEELYTLTGQSLNQIRKTGRYSPTSARGCG